MANLSYHSIKLGVFDPLPNFLNEKLVACNIVRVKYWIGERNAHISPSLLELLGTFSSIFIDFRL